MTNIMAITTSTSSSIPQIRQVMLPGYYFPFKLEHNYMVWKAQIFPAIVGSNMEGFIRGEIQPPPNWHIKESSKPLSNMWGMLDFRCLAEMFSERKVISSLILYCFVRNRENLEL